MGTRSAATVAFAGWVALAGGCGRIGYEPLASSPDAALDAQTDALPGPPCRSADGFAAPTALSALSSSIAESSLRLAADGTGVFSRASGGGGVLRGFSTKLSKSGFSPPEEISGPVNDGDVDGPTLSADGSVLLFASTRGGGGYDLWGSLLLGGEFSSPSPITQLNSAQAELSPYLLASGKAVYFTRVLPAAGVALMRAVETNGEISEPTVAATIPVVTSPVVSEDELELFYAVNGDIYRSTRNSVTEPFAAGLRSAALSTADEEEPTWLSSDGCTLYLASNRAGSSDLWVTTRR